MTDKFKQELVAILRQQLDSDIAYIDNLNITSLTDENGDGDAWLQAIVDKIDDIDGASYYMHYANQLSNDIMSIMATEYYEPLKDDVQARISHLNN
jgi:hypothetical protein